MDEVEKKVPKKRDEIDLIELFIKIWSFRKLIIIITSVITIVGILYALLVQHYYKSETTLYQVQEENNNISGLTSLASQFGFGGFSSTSDYNIGDLVNSRYVGDKIIYKKWKTEKYDSIINLIDYWQINADTERRKFEKAMEKLNKNLTYSEDKETNLITITSVMEEPQLSADIANYTVQLIEEYVRNVQKTNTKENIHYIGERLLTTSTELENAENALKIFNEKNRDISSSPELQLQLGRLQREITIKQEIYLELQRQKELALIDLVKETPIINILDKAIKPELKYKPKRAIIVIVSGFIGIFISILVVVLKDLIKTIRKNYSIKRSTNF